MGACGEGLWEIHAGPVNQEGSCLLVGIRKGDTIRLAGVVPQLDKESGLGWVSVAVPDMGDCPELVKSTDRPMAQWDLGSQ